MIDTRIVAIAYLEAIEFTEFGPDGAEDGMEFPNWADGIRRACLDEVTHFVATYPTLVARALVAGLTPEQIGHDLWLTRNGHGTGFWDRKLPGSLGNQLTAAAGAMGTSNAYLGDDGLHYLDA